MEVSSDHLIYLQGFLDSISYLNTFDNDGKTYRIELLKKVNNNYQDTLRKYFNVKHWMVSTELVTSDWKTVLKTESRRYFDQIIGEVFKKHNQHLIYDSRGGFKEDANELIESVKHDNHFYVDHLLQEKFIESIEKIVGKDPKLYKVEIDWHSSNEGWYELYYHDLSLIHI